MNFFEAQESARRSSSLLILLFILAIAVLLILSNFIVVEFGYFLQYQTLTLSLVQLERVYDSDLAVLVSAAILGFICLGSLYKLLQLSAGGMAIAQHLGGVIVPRSSNDPVHQKILNVVEEMAIASGTPVPQVYLLEEQGINAFAAGWKTTNAVIGITRGALERLNRDELQGVIAHEFSHIFNGDMRLNIRLIAVLHGILMIGMLGRVILRSLRFARTSRTSRGGGQAVLLIAGIGAALAVLGYSGTFFGNWIKSLISRQREFLADASAVQFTRNSEGIANALKKIGGAIPGSALLAVAVDEYSHAYFAQGDSSMHYFTLSTHPPLRQRILRIQPDWDGNYIPEERPSAKQHADAGYTAGRKRHRKTLATAVATGVGYNEALNAVANIGDISQPQLDAARYWRQQLPDIVQQYANSPYDAQALVCAILMDANNGLQQQQYKLLGDAFGEQYTANIRRLQQPVIELRDKLTLSLLDLVLPALREMTVDQYRQFSSSVQRLIEMDRKVNLREWIIQRVLLQHLDEFYGLRSRPLAKYFVLGSAKYACELVLSLLAYIEHADEKQARLAFDRAIQSIDASALTMLPKQAVSLSSLNSAMDELELLKPPLKKRLLQACVSCIDHDGRVTIKGYELTRAVASCLDCPMPPVNAVVT